MVKKIGMFLGLIVLGLSACAQERKVYIMRGEGKCRDWSRIENVNGRWKGYCGKTKPGRKGVICTRQKGPHVYHHNHGTESCYWVWR